MNRFMVAICPPNFEKSEMVNDYSIWVIDNNRIISPNKISFVNLDGFNQSHILWRTDSDKHPTFIVDTIISLADIICYMTGEAVNTFRNYCINGLTRDTDAIVQQLMEDIVTYSTGGNLIASIHGPHGSCHRFGIVLKKHYSMYEVLVPSIGISAKKGFNLSLDSYKFDVHKISSDNLSIVGFVGTCGLSKLVQYNIISKVLSANL